MTTWKRAASLILGCALLGLGTSAFAQQSKPEFTIAPPPLAYPDYSEPGTSQQKLALTYIGVSTEAFDMNGYGASFTSRTVGGKDEDELGSGLSFGLGLYILSGEGSGISLSGFQLPLVLNYEAELAPAFIAFGGINFTQGYISMTSSFADIDVYTTLFGFQAGGQISFEADTFTTSPWLMFQQSSGSVSVDVYPAGGGYFGTTEDITVTSLVIGFDVLHVPSGVTLSGLLQQASGNSDSDVTILQLSWSWGGSDDPEAPGR